MKRLGQRIKRKREGLQLRLNELAQKVGISSSALSQIENAKAFPSIITLKNVADALHTTVGELIGENETLSKQPLISSSQKRFVKANPSGAQLFLLSHHDPYKQMETYLIEFAPQADSDRIMISHPGQEFFHVTEGQLEFVLDETKYLLFEGDSFYFDSNQNHFAKNMSGSVCKVIWVVTPPNI